MLAGGLVCATMSAFMWRASSPAHAETTLSSFGFVAGARGWRFFDEDATNGNQEAEVPESSANLSNGPVGYGLSSLAWPGPLAANAGSLILVLRPDAPSQVTALNSPIRAEARSGQNPPTTTTNVVPGTSMVATVKPDLVEALATVDNSAGPGTFGPSHTHALTTVVDNAGKSSADSLVQNINLEAGVVKIVSVSSVAEATTDGVKSHGDAHTTVNGLTIAGQPATIDEDGLHIGTQNEPANAVANQIAEQALGKSGMSLTLSQPSRESNGATTTVTAGSLVVSWNTGTGSVFTVTLGGTTATVTAAPGIGGVSNPEGPSPLVGGGTSPLPANGTAGLVSAPAGPTTATPLVVPIGPKAAGGTSPLAAPSLALASRPRLLSTASAVLGLLAAGLMALGMRRLGDRILAEPTAAPCPLAEGDA
jgi:hypothetical protein